MSVEVVFAVLRADGQIKRRGSNNGLYISEKAAIRWATTEGDSVVRAVIDLECEPTYIFKAKL